MAFTTTTRIKDYIRYSGVGFHENVDNDAITNGVNGANGFLEKIGVPSTETDAGLLMQADLLALSYLIPGEIMRMIQRNEIQAAGSLRLFAESLPKFSIEMVQPYISVTRKATTIVNNRNWAHQRGGPLRVGSEAGRYARRTR